MPRTYVILLLYSCHFKCNRTSQRHQNYFKNSSLKKKKKTPALLDLLIADDILRWTEAFNHHK